jgi:hypothetical protein
MPLPNLIKNVLGLTPTFCFPIPVWGSYYISQFLRYCVPSLLAEGNLPYMAKQGKVKLILTTTSDGRTEIERSELLQRLSSLAEVIFDVVESPTSTTMSHCHNRGFELCGQGYVFFVLADHILPENGLATLHAHLTENIEALQIIAPRVKHSGMRDAIERYRKDDIISAPQADLNALSFAVLDDTMYWRDINGPVFTNWPSSLMERSKKTTCVRFFHLHLIALKNQCDLRIDDSSTFDARFLAKAVPNPDHVRTIDDCSVFFMPSTVPDLFLHPTESTHTDRPIANVGKSALVETADWARKQADAYEWNNFKNFKIILSTDASDAPRLLDNALVNQISQIAHALNYFEGADPKMVEEHNMEGLMNEDVQYIIVDNLDPRILPHLSTSKKLLSIDGLTSLQSREVQPLSSVQDPSKLQNVFLHINPKAMVYLRKMLALGMIPEALYTVTGVFSCTKKAA